MPHLVKGLCDISVKAMKVKKSNTKLREQLKTKPIVKYSEEKHLGWQGYHEKNNIGKKDMEGYSTEKNIQRTPKSQR